MWILIIFMYAGLLSRSDSVAITSVNGFQSEMACQQAGKKIKSLETLFKDSKFICVRTE